MGYSIKKLYDLLWKTSARYGIKNSDTFLLAIGPNTHKSKSVKKEVKIARIYKKPIKESK